VTAGGSWSTARAGSSPSVRRPSLARVVVQPCRGGISVWADGLAGPTITPPPVGAPLLTVTRLALHPAGAAAGPEADAWFSAFLGHPVRLVFLERISGPGAHGVDPQYGRPGDVVSFADGYPLLLTSTGSLGELGGWPHRRAPGAGADDPVPASVVVAGAPPWAEDRWRRIRIGAVPFPRGQALRAVRRHHH